MGNLSPSFSGIKALVIEVQVDDFGTGYSSLAYLQRLPVDALKIDKSFVAGIGLQKEALQIIRAILSLAQGLDVKVVAEGIETDAQNNTLRQMDCSMGQGYYFSKPLAPEAAIELLGDFKSLQAFDSSQDKPTTPQPIEMIRAG